MTAAIRAAVTYGLHADTYLVAHALDRVLEGYGWRISVERGDVEDEVWISPRSGSADDAVRFEPGRRLIVMSDGAWRIENAAAAP